MNDDTIHALRRAGRRRSRIEQQRSEASQALSAAVRAADASGMPKTTIAREAGISRQTVHEMLREDKAA